MKCNYCYKKPSVVIKTKHEAVNFDMYLCNGHSKEEIVFLNSKWKRKEQELLSIYLNWMKENKLIDKCNAYFISKTSMLVFQVWKFEKMISETLWIKIDNEKWQFYIKNLGEKFNKDFSLEKILKIEKDFVLKTFKEKANL